MDIDSIPFGEDRYQMIKNERYDGELTGSLESQVRDRTGQLEASFEELNRTQNELINRERYKTLGAVAAGHAHR